MHTNAHVITDNLSKNKAFRVKKKRALFVSNIYEQLGLVSNLMVLLIQQACTKDGEMN